MTLNINSKEHRAILELAAECNIGLPKENTTMNQLTNRTKHLLGWIKKKNVRPTKKEREESKKKRKQKEAEEVEKKEEEKLKKLRKQFPTWQPWLGHVPPIRPPPKPFLEKSSTKFAKLKGLRLCRRPLCFSQHAWLPAAGSATE